MTSLELLKLYDSLKRGQRRICAVTWSLLSGCRSTSSDDITDSASKASVTGINAGRGLCWASPENSRHFTFDRNCSFVAHGSTVCLRWIWPAVFQLSAQSTDVIKDLSNDRIHNF